MSLSEDLKGHAGPLWEKTVTHPFVMELGDGTLPEEKFSVYFQQDHLFLRDWIALMCAGIARAPDFDHARPLAAFVQAALGAEEGLFQGFFRDTGLSQQGVRDLKYLPTAYGYSSFLRRVAAECSFVEIITTGLGIEWPYLDWGKRLAGAGKRPQNRYYQTWIDIHAGKELDDFVTWMRRVVDGAPPGDTARQKEIFLTTLRYEYLFWEMAYRGERWPE
jgi:thiaminase/transcriptional activator TenA